MKPIIYLALVTALTVTAICVYSHRLSKKRRWEYDCAYATLQFLLHYGIVDRPGYKYIKSKFAEIAKMECCNYERCQVLEQEFYLKYQEIAEEYEKTLQN